MPDNQTPATSPFHDGERQVQERLGVRDKVETLARRAVRDHMPDQHRAFYEKLPFVLLGTVDKNGRPWASLLAGAPGFMATPDDKSLNIQASPLPGDPLAENLEPGASVAILGIEPETRRRNRMSGRLAAIFDGRLEIAVKQTFGNCPQYIQTRTVEPQQPHADGDGGVIARMQAFDARASELIAAADTLFIATADTPTTNAEAVQSGADVSHRGGKPGFVQLEDDRTFVFPDFSGNNHFNTLGNIVLNPRAGFLFVDFDRGDLLYMTGTAAIDWDGPSVQAFAGAERLVRFTLDEAIYVAGALPLRFTFGDYSPMLSTTGSWQQAQAAIAADAARNTYIEYEVIEVVPESDVISSFYLCRADGGPLADYQPGQFLPIRLRLPGHDAPVARTYTLSDVANADTYRLSIKREGGDALVSNFLHANAKPGYRLEAMAPRGKFTLDPASTRPVVLLTPMIAMANALVAGNAASGGNRRIRFIHAALNGKVHAFGDHVRSLQTRDPGLSVHVRYSDPLATDRLGITHDSEGHIDRALLSRLLPLDDYDFYLCGPPPFMTAMFGHLIALGVREHRIQYESFGPATVLKTGVDQASTADKQPAPAAPVTVRFAQSGIAATSTSTAQTLLELAEASGIEPTYSCRSGVCGSCATRLISGAVEYCETPTAEHGDEQVLLCCAVPARAPAASGTAQSDIVLDL